MDDDWIGFRAGFSPGCVQCTALPALASVADSVLVGDFSLGKSLQAHAEAGRVHHDEHGLEAFFALTDKPALRSIVVHDAGRIAVDAHLLLERAAGKAVALAQAAIFVDQKLRDHEQADALDGVGSIRTLCEHQVDDILAKVVLARGDEDLRAGDRVGAVVIWLGPCLQQPEVGACVRLGKIHRAGPFAGDHVRQIALLQLVGRL